MSGIFEAIGSVVGGAASKAFDSFIDFGGKWAEDKYINDPNSAEAYKRQKDFYKNRYQWMMKDMAAAGLNPILAAGSAGFSTAGTPAVQFAKPSGAGGESLASSARNLADIGLIEEKTVSERVQQMKTLQETKTELMNTFKTRNEARVASAEEARILTESLRIIKDTQRIVSQKDLNESQMNLLNKEFEQLALQMNKLRRYAEVYDSNATKILAVIRAIAESIGLNTVLSGSAAKILK